jgi:hypothetical protein
MTVGFALSNPVTIVILIAIVALVLYRQYRSKVPVSAFITKLKSP